MADNEEKKLRVPYALAFYGDEEIATVNKVLNSHKTMQGEYTKKFEEKISSLFGKKYSVMVNSGSSANLLAFEILNLPKGSEVVTPILTFSTTIAPLVQKNLIPSFIDVEIGSYQADLGQLKDAVNEKTKCLMIPNLIGNIPDLSFIKKIASDNNLKFVEDSCDTLGSKFEGKPTGEYSDISTSSFYGSHIITAGGGGGVICVNDPDWYRRCRVLAAWGRSSAVDEAEDMEKRFKAEIDGIQYDSKFIFEEVGYNFLPLEMGSAFGLEQLKKLDKFIETRKKNFSELMKFFSKYKEFFILPEQLEKSDANWLAFPLTIQSNAPFSRVDIVKFLENNNIQTRSVFTGNLLRQPGFKNITYKSFKKEFPNADYIMKNSFIVGCHQGLSDEHITYMKNIFSSFLDKF
jgi:CDP-6-deoxy-D-xylo-4-hexulose-3-dehydrase